MTRLRSLLVALIFASTIAWAPAQAAPAVGVGAGVIDPAVQAALASLPPGGMLSVIVKLKADADLSTITSADHTIRTSQVVKALQAHALTQQHDIQAALLYRLTQGAVREIIPFWVFNGLKLTAIGPVILWVASRPEVESITPDVVQVKPVTSSMSDAPPEQNLSVINAPALWSAGMLGDGVVVATLDTGVDATHPDLSAKWRGGSDGWYDPYGEHSTPADVNGHGTWTMGVIVGGTKGGTAIGVAPNAKWIAAKIFNDRGQATATAIHKSLQWILAPSGDPNAPNAPNVLNNSWAYGNPGCNTAFRSDLRSIRAAGILPIFAAGNYGPTPSTSVSPANYPESLAVGATDNTDQIASFSSRGPAGCAQGSTTYPTVVAPGVNIRTTDLCLSPDGVQCSLQGYTVQSGTSLSAPHVAGELALLLSAHPGLTADQQATAVTRGTLDLGVTGPDNTFGIGRIDALAANQSLSDTLFADGFESGDLSAWTSATGATNIAVTTSARMGKTGTKGMQVTLRGNTPGYVTYQLPTAEPKYHARFYFNPNGSVPGPGQQDILVALDPASANVFRVQYSRASTGNHQVRVGVSSATGESFTPWFTFSNTAHAFEVAWTSGTAGSLTLYIDGRAQSTLAGLDTSASTVQTVSLGPSNGISSTASGTEYFDEFASTRTGLIGP